jgi:hypothetical protein
VAAGFAAVAVVTPAGGVTARIARVRNARRHRLRWQGSRVRWRLRGRRSIGRTRAKGPCGVCPEATRDPRPPARRRCLHCADDRRDDRCHDARQRVHAEPRSCWQSDERNRDAAGRGVRGLGTLNAVMLFVDFPDAPAIETTRSLYDVLAPGSERNFASQSFGRLALRITEVPHWYRISKNARDYGVYRGARTGFYEHRAYMQEAVNLADAAAGWSSAPIPGSIASAVCSYAGRRSRATTAPCSSSPAA